MFNLGLVVVALVFCTNAAWVRQNPTPSAPSQAAPSAPHAASPAPTQQAKPIKPSPQATVHAKAIYGYDCAVCHGAKGDGKGDLAKETSMAVPDFTDPTVLKGKTDEELFNSIKNGKGQMTGEEDRAKTDELWALVLYCRSFAKKTAQGSAAK